MARKNEVSQDDSQFEMLEAPATAPVEQDFEETMVESVEEENEVSPKISGEKPLKEEIEEKVEEEVEEKVEEEVEEKIYLAKISFSFGGKIYYQGTIVQFSEELVEELLSKKAIYLKE